MKNEILKHLKVIFSIFIGIIFIFSVKDRVYALEDVDNYTPQYKQYLELSEEEKRKIDVIPNKYGISLKEYNLNKRNKIKTLYNSNNSNLQLPVRYNLAENYNIKVENQGLEGNCWTFASLETLETYLQIHGYGTYDFSENHLNYIESNIFSESSASREVNTAGHFEEFKDYVSKKFGPVSEKEFPYYEPGTTTHKKYTSEEYKSLLNVTPIAYVGDYAMFPYVDKENQEYSEEELNDFRNSVKKHIMENGAIFTQIVAPTYYQDVYYNSNTYAAYFPNSYDFSFWEHSHAVSIIGWDDNFSKENFVEENKPKHDGAYIVLNSWGNEFGDNGLYYISYDDVYVEKNLNAITEAVTDMSNLKNTTTFSINDKNLYNGLKQVLGRKILSYDDNSNSITILTGIINEIVELDLHNLNITDLSGLDNFTNLCSINLANNNISTIEPLKSLHKLDSLDLSYNRFEEIPKELNESTLSKLSLNYNPIKNFDNLKNITEVRDLKLEGTNITNNELNLLENVQIVSLNLAKTHTNDYSTLNTKNILDLNISYNENIIYESIPNVMSLNISHTNADENCLKNIKDISLINSLDVSYTNIKDLSILPNTLRYINISGNKDSINFESLKYVSEITYKDAELQDVSLFEGFYASHINLSNNNIENYSVLLNNEYLTMLDLSDNKIKEIEYSDRIVQILDENYINPFDYIPDNITSMKNQTFEDSINIDTSRDNMFIYLTNCINSLQSSGYDLTLSNVSMDNENNTYIIDDLDKDVKIEITSGKLEGSNITYKIKKISESNIKFIYIDETKLRKNYIEGDNFDKSGIKVYAIYDNDTVSEVYDYELIGSENLKKGINTVTLKKDSFTESININVIPKEDVLTLKFYNKDIYNATLDKIKQVENLRKQYASYYSRLEVLINKDDEFKTIQIYKEDLDEITYLDIKSDDLDSLEDLKQLTSLNSITINSKNFNDLSQLYYIKENLEFQEDLPSYEKLIGLEIKNNQNIISINDNIYKSLSIENSNIKNINNLTNLNILKYRGNKILEMEQILGSLDVVDVNITSNIEDIKRDKNNNIILPDIFKYFYNNGYIINICIFDQIKDEQYLYPYNISNIEAINKDGNILIDFSKLKERKYDGKNQFIEIVVKDTNMNHFKFDYKYMIKYKLFNHLESDSTIPIDIEENTVPDLSNLKIYKVYSNKEKMQINDYMYNKDIITKNTNSIKISYSEDGITDELEIPINVVQHSHEWGEWNIIKNPTETEEGLKERICIKNNNHKQISKIEKLPDNSNIENDTDLTEKKSKNPKTGDNLDLCLLVLLCTSSIEFMILLLKNKKVN